MDGDIKQDEGTEMKESGRIERDEEEERLFKIALELRQTYVEMVDRWEELSWRLPYIAEYRGYFKDDWRHGPGDMTVFKK